MYQLFCIYFVIFCLWCTRFWGDTYMLFEPIGCAFSCKGIDYPLLLGYEVACLCWAKFRCIPWFVKISNLILTRKLALLFTNSLSARIFGCIS